MITGVHASPVAGRGWDPVTSLELANGERIGMYEPRHPRP